MDHARNIATRGAKAHRQRQLVHELSGSGRHGHATHQTPIIVRQNLDKTLSLAGRQAAVVIEYCRHTNPHVAKLVTRFRLGETHRRHFWSRKYAARHGAVGNTAVPAAKHIAECNLALVGSRVSQAVRTNHVASGENVGIRSPHPLIDANAETVIVDNRGIQANIRIRPFSARHEHLIDQQGLLPAINR